MGFLFLQVQLLVYRALSHSLILPWPNIPDSEQNWSSRGMDHQAFVRQLARHFLQLKDTRALAANKGMMEEGKQCCQLSFQVAICNQMKTI